MSDNSPARTNISKKSIAGVVKDENIFSDDHPHDEIIADMRLQLNERLNARVSDHDCLRFLRARAGSVPKAVEMLQNQNEWYHKLMDPIPPRSLLFSPNTALLNPDMLDTHPHKELIAVAHHGFDKEGHPIYWEKTGLIQSNFDEVIANFSIEQLLQYHVASQELMEMRLKFATNKYKRDIGKSVTVFDMKHLTISLDTRTIWYIKQLLAIDQAFYPERLHILFIINCPWYFTMLYSMFKALIDKRTSDKFKILGSDYISVLEEHIDRHEIPIEMGGDAIGVAWSGPFTPESGASNEQMHAGLKQNFTANKEQNQDISALLTDEEVDSVRAAMVIIKDEKPDMFRTLAAPWNTVSSVDASPATTTSNLSATPTSSQSNDDDKDAELGHSNVDNKNNSSSSSSNNLGNTNTNILLPTSADLSGSEAGGEGHEDDGGEGEDRDGDRDRERDSICGGSSMMFLGTEVTVSEDGGSYHRYIIRVRYMHRYTWQVKKRFREFVVLRSQLKKLRDVSPLKSMEKLPPKVLFGRKSADVVARRLVGLNTFLQSVIACIATPHSVGSQFLLHFLDPDLHRNQVGKHMDVTSPSHLAAMHTPVAVSYVHSAQVININLSAAARLRTTSAEITAGDRIRRPSGASTGAGNSLTPVIITTDSSNDTRVSGAHQYVNSRRREQSGSSGDEHDGGETDSKKASLAAPCPFPPPRAVQQQRARARSWQYHAKHILRCIFRWSVAVFYFVGLYLLFTDQLSLILPSQ